MLASKPARHVALRGESAGVCDLGQGALGLGQQLSRPVEAHVDQRPMNADPGRVPERARKPILCHAQRFCDVTQTHVRVHVLLHEIDRSPPLHR
jgi:hypothetical protein